MDSFIKRALERINNDEEQEGEEQEKSVEAQEQTVTPPPSNEEIRTETTEQNDETTQEVKKEPTHFIGESIQHGLEDNQITEELEIQEEQSEYEEIPEETADKEELADQAQENVLSQPNDEPPVTTEESVSQEQTTAVVEHTYEENAKLETTESKEMQTEKTEQQEPEVIEQNYQTEESSPASEEIIQPTVETQEETVEEPELERNIPKGGFKKRHSLDNELEELLAQVRARIKIVGCGGAGNNTITRIAEMEIFGTQSIAVNTDAQDLLYTSADEKILIGKELTKGLGAGSIPKVGEEAAHESEQDIKQILQNADLVFVTCGLGGGTGTGSAPIVAQTAKKNGALTVGIVTLPFTMEGVRRSENAVQGLDKLMANVDTLIVIPNDRLLDLAPELPLHTAFKVADEILASAVKGMAELITKPGLVNLDFADIRAVMGNGGLALIGMGESESDNRAVESVEKAINNPLLDVDVSGASGALINIVGGDSLTLEEARKVVELVSNKVDQNARVIWGAQIDEDLGNMIRTLLIVTGVKSSEIWASSKKASEKRKEEIEAQLGISFVQ